MTDRLAGKTAFITAAGQGIGRATAEAFVREGARVIATDINDELLADLARTLRCETRRLDVTDASAVLAASIEANAKSTVNVLFNAAGFVHHGTILDCDEVAFDFSIDLNVRAMYRVTRAFLPPMLKAGGGSIVNFGSINSIGAEKLLTTYTASKGAVLTLTKAIALDFGAQGIRANTVCPGFVDTPLNVPHYEALGGREALEAGLPDFQPIGRAIEPIEIAHSVAFLLSDHSTAITGTAFVVDGGVLAGA